MIVDGTAWGVPRNRTPEPKRVPPIDKARDCLWCEMEVDGDFPCTWNPPWPFYSLPAGWWHPECEEEAQDQEYEERSLRAEPGKDGES